VQATMVRGTFITNTPREGVSGCTVDVTPFRASLARDSSSVGTS
jgi:hypothetical protein